MNRKRNLSTLYKKRGVNRRKTVSECPAFLTLPQTQISRQYSSLAQESIHKDFQVSGLKPFQSHRTINQIQSELSGLKIVIPEVSIFGSSNLSLVKQKMKAIMQESKKVSKRKRRKNFGKKIQQNQQKVLIEDFLEELKTDRKVKHQILDNLNKKIIDCFPTEVDFEEETFREKRGLLRFKKQKKVSYIYRNEEVDLWNRKGKKQELSKEIKKSCYGIYSKSTKKMYDMEEKDKGIEVKKGKGRAGKYEKVFYDNYLCSYSAKKNVIKSLLD